ncbi:MAG: hypothetical protein OQK94_07990, partial [Gammaproteobacteria bacterium]|nr:hypothetical protein [Gammaproteobacteria bacterium]
MNPSNTIHSWYLDTDVGLSSGKRPVTAKVTSHFSSHTHVIHDVVVAGIPPACQAMPDWSGHR